MKPEPIADHELGGRCEHGDCRELATVWCACLCGRQLCDAHEFEERREFQVRQGLALIRHRPEAQRVRAMRAARRLELLQVEP